MRNLSIVATILLIIPVGGILLSAIQIYYMERKLLSHQFLYETVFREATSILIYLVFFVIALILNTRQKYLENSIMCGTLIISFILFYTANLLTTLLIPFLHHAG